MQETLAEKGCGKMSDVTCQNCQYYISRIQKLQAENKTLRKIIAKLEARIREATIEANAIIHNADKIMSEHQPRGRWSFAKGAKRAAWVIRSLLTGV
jgi:hypothetical protein